MKKRLVAVIEFEDEEDDIQDTHEAASWLMLELREAKRLDVTVYRILTDAAKDEAEKAGPFAHDAIALPE